MERLIIYGHNVNGLRSRTDQLKLNDLNVGADIFLITEANIFNGATEAEIFDLSEYKAFRRDRESTSCAEGEKSGGGVMIGGRKRFSVRRREDFQSEAEDMWITILGNDGHSKIHVCCAVHKKWRLYGLEYYYGKFRIMEIKSKNCILRGHQNYIKACQDDINVHPKFFENM